jgi:hypothetical protein
MYTTLLLLHSWIRWITLIAIVGATLAAVRGKVQGADSAADRWGLFAVSALDLRMLLGLILYFIASPNAGDPHFGGVMKTRNCAGRSST